MAKPPSNGKLLYHITQIENLQSIISSGMLLPRNEVARRAIVIADIADQSILASRRTWKTDLSDYNLFHFYTRNPFDCAVCHAHGKENMAIITIRRDFAKKNQFKIIPSHPLGSEEPDILEYDAGMEAINWELLDADDRDYNIDAVRKACMAECITQTHISVDHFFSIYCFDEAAFERISVICQGRIVKVEINPYMFP